MAETGMHDFYGASAPVRQGLRAKKYTTAYCAQPPPGAKQGCARGVPAPAGRSVRWLIFRRLLKLLLRRIDIDAQLVAILLAEDRDLVETDGHLLGADAEEAADIDDEMLGIALIIDDHVGDRADRFIIRIVDGGTRQVVERGLVHLLQLLVALALDLGRGEGLAVAPPFRGAGVLALHVRGRRLVAVP